MTAIEQKGMEQLNERITELSNSVKDIRDALLGNEYNDKSSYKARLEALEEFKAKAQVDMMRAKVWGAALGVIFWTVFEIIYKYSTIFSNFQK